MSDEQLVQWVRARLAEEVQRRVRAEVVAILERANELLDDDKDERIMQAWDADVASGRAVTVPWEQAKRELGLAPKVRKKPHWSKAAREAAAERARFYATERKRKAKR